MSSTIKQKMEYLESFTIFSLMLMGLTGVAYHLFRHGGWIETLTGNAWEFTLRSPLIALSALAGAIYIEIAWRRTRRTKRDHGKLATAVFYVMTAAGLYFLGRLAVVGTL